MSKTTTRKANKPATTPALMNVLVAVRKAGRTTAAAINSNAVYALRLEEQGLIRRVDTVKSGKRGRPAIIWGCTDKGRKRADRALKA